MVTINANIINWLASSPLLTEMAAQGTLDSMISSALEAEGLDGDAQISEEAAAKAVLKRIPSGMFSAARFTDLLLSDKKFKPPSIEVALLGSQRLEREVALTVVFGGHFYAQTFESETGRGPSTTPPPVSIPSPFRLHHLSPQRLLAEYLEDSFVSRLLRPGDDRENLKQKIEDTVNELASSMAGRIFLRCFKNSIACVEDLNINKINSLAFIIIPDLVRMDLVSEYRSVVRLPVIRYLESWIEPLRYLQGLELHERALALATLSPVIEPIHSHRRGLSSGFREFQGGVENALEKIAERMGGTQFSKNVKEAFYQYLLLGEDIRRLMMRLQRFQRLVALEAPENLLNNEARMVLEEIPEIKIDPTELLESNRSLIAQLPRAEYLPLLGGEMDYQTWAEAIVLSGGVEGLRFILDLKVLEDLSPEDRFAFFYDHSPLSEKVFLSRTIFDLINGGSMEEAGLIFVDQKYEELVSVLPRRLGALAAPEPQMRFYQTRAENFYRAALGYRKTYDRRDAGRSELIDAWVDHQEEKQRLSEFLISNPSPELLKSAFRYWNQKLSPGAPAKKKPTMTPGKKIKLISDRELNALNWIVAHIPKGTLTRDARRQLHDFVLHLVERRIQREDDPVAYFMAELLIRLKTDLKDRQDRVDCVTAFLKFALVFTYMPRKLQKNKLRRLQGRLSKAIQAKAEETLVLTKIHFDALYQEILQVFADSVLEEPLTLKPEEVAEIRQSMEKYSAAWLRGDLLPALARYAGFQDEEGKKAVEKYFLLLARSEIREGIFTNLPRYTWQDRTVQEWFGDSLIRKIQKGYQGEMSRDEKENSLQARYKDIFNDILTHLELQDVEVKDWREVLSRRFEKAKLSSEDLENFLGWLLKVSIAVMGEGEIAPDVIEKWKSRLQAMALHRVFPYATEVVMNLEQLRIVQKIKNEDGPSFSFVVTEEPVAFLRSGEQPVYTCQRIIEPTGFNKQGWPINRARQGQFFLGQAKQGDKIVERTHLEIAREKKDKGKILLVERFYTDGSLSSGDFQRAILEWAATTEEIDFVVFSSRGSNDNGITTKIVLDLLPSEGAVYRDTQWPSTINAIDLKKWREKRGAPLPTATQARSGLSHHVR